MVDAQQQCLISSLAAQHLAVHRRLSRWMRKNACRWPEAWSIYVHVLSAEDVIVQVLVRGEPPLMLGYAPEDGTPPSWHQDPGMVQRYARAVRSATRDQLRVLRLGGADGPPVAALTLQRLLVPCLSRACQEIAAMSTTKSNLRDPASANSRSAVCTIGHR